MHATPHYARCDAAPATLRRWLALALVLAAGLAMPCAMAATPAVADDDADWRDAILYFVLLDRFDDGDRSNNDQGQGEYDPADHRRFSGGDLAGVQRRLDYIQGLGATAVWITPPVANQWWSERAQYGGYHGYWARDFKVVDAHFGTLADYRRLADALHGRGMALVQDIVVNHTGDYFGWDHGHDPARPAQGFALRAQADGATAPSQAPFDRNDVRDPAQRAAAIYHWTPSIRDFADRRQELDGQLADLDDLDTENPVVRAALRDSYGHWIREVGVDGFRVDTAFYVPPAYFADFLHAEDPLQPGVMAVAAAAGKPAFHVFGEGFGIDRPYDDAMARKIETYARDDDGRALLPAMINFPLYGTLADVFARGHPPAELGDRIQRMMRIHADPWRMPTFVDNHDVDRFLAAGDEAGLRQALLAIMTLPGIPTIYYGTEQGLRAPRAAMFAGGYGAGGRDRFDTGAPLYRDLRARIALRRGHRVLSRGTPVVLDANAATRGALAWRMDHGDARALVVMNTADHPTLLDGLHTGLPPHARLVPLHGVGGRAPAAGVDADGRLSLVLPPRAGFVWLARGVQLQRPAGPAPVIDNDGLPSRVRDALDLHGRAPGATRAQLVVDGDLDAAAQVPVDADGRWRARVDTADMIDPALEHRVVARDPDGGGISPAHRFRVTRDWTRVAAVEDPAGDDTGPDGRYVYPDDAGWRVSRPADLLGAEVWRSGGALRLRLKMRAILRDWNPANGFDHVAFSVFFALHGRDGGVTTMPHQHATLPDGMRWHVRLRAHGWSNALFAAEGASADADGAVLGTAARIEVDRDAGTVTFTLPASSLAGAVAGAHATAGARIHVTTWDYDGGYRPLAPTATGNTFGGGQPGDPRVMDALTLVLPTPN